MTARRLLMPAVFIAGMTTLAIEISASRLVGTVFGTSNIVWANIIGLILIYLSAGYFIGGRWADRSPHARTFYRILAWGAFASGLVPIAAKPALRVAAAAVQDLDAVIMGGSFLGVLVLFSIPVTLLGCASPFAIRLALDHREMAGRVAGRVYAISTLGSIVGTFLPVLWLIPAVGTARTFLVFSILLLLLALIGITADGGVGGLLRHVWMPVVLLLLALLTLPGPIKGGGSTVFETESAYNYIQVTEREGVRLLLLNEGLAEHSIYLPASARPPYGYGTWEFFLAAPYFNPAPVGSSPVQRLGLVGLAGGTIAKQYTEVFGSVPIDGWEIDPAIVEVARTYFDMNEPNLNAIVADGRWGLSQSEHAYSVIAIDAYRAPYIPWELTTVEFFELVRQRLAHDGVLAVNIGRTPDDRRLIEAISGTISTVFPSLYLVDVPASFNSILYATLQPTEASNLVENLLQLEADGAPTELLAVLERTVANIRTVPQSEVVFTDDRAPVEQLVNSIVLRFVLGGMEGLP